MYRIIAITVLIAILLLAIAPMIYLYFSDARIVKYYFTSYYLVDLRDSENEIELLNAYMSDRGYILSFREGGSYHFMKDEDTRIVYNKNLKTIFRKK